jgi:hypothetical protein
MGGNDEMTVEIQWLGVSKVQRKLKESKLKESVCRVIISRSRGTLSKQNQSERETRPPPPPKPSHEGDLRHPP